MRNPFRRSPEPAPRQHLLIAGTGRAGTSFLVRYLNALGLETSMSGGEPPGWNEEANAGLEALPVTAVSGKLPYVIKSPWTYEVIDQMLADPVIRLDAVIVPMRDLVEAASSRTILELRAIHGDMPWMADCDRTWETWAHTPGGAVYSLSPIDQARLLAVGFHQLIHRLTAADVPMVFLDFPRFVEDTDYLYRQLRPVLPEAVSLEGARQAHAATADPGNKVRVGAELAKVTKPSRPVSLISGPNLGQLDRVAMARELKRRVGEVNSLQAEVAALKAQLSAERKRA